MKPNEESIEGKAMSGFIKEDENYFEGFDFENAKPIKHPLIAKAQAKHKAEQIKLEQKPSIFEPDVWRLIMSNANNSAEIAKINGVLRAMLA